MNYKLLKVNFYLLGQINYYKVIMRNIILNALPVNKSSLAFSILSPKDSHQRFKGLC